MTKSEVACDNLDDAFWDAPAESIIREEPRDKHVYDLEERTAKFGEVAIDFAKTIPQDAVTNRIISQLVAAATSVGANYVEADDAVSKKDFLKTIGTCRKEARNETLSSHGRSRGARAKTESAKALVGSKGVASHLFENLAKQRAMTKHEGMTKTKDQNSHDDFLVIRASSLIRHSSFPSFVIFIIGHLLFGFCHFYHA